MHILELAEVATKPRLFRKIHRDENNCRERNGDDQRTRPTLRPLQSDVGQSFAAQQNQSAPDADQQHFNNCIQDKPLLQIDRHLNKSTENRIEKERHRQQYDDVDQIAPPPRSATFSACLNVAFCHSLEIIVTAQKRKANRRSQHSRREYVRREAETDRRESARALMSGGVNQSMEPMGI